MTKALLGIMAAALAGIIAISAAIMSRDDADAVQAGAANPESVSQVQADTTDNLRQLNGGDQAGDLAKQASESKATTKPSAEVSEATANTPPAW